MSSPSLCSPNYLLHNQDYFTINQSMGTVSTSSPQPSQNGLHHSNHVKHPSGPHQAHHPQSQTMEHHSTVPLHHNHDKPQKLHLNLHQLHHIHPVTYHNDTKYHNHSHRVNDSISSMNSDSTVDSDHKKRDSIHSTTTLVEESPKFLSSKLPTLSINEEDDKLSPINVVNLNNGVHNNEDTNNHSSWNNQQYKLRSSSLIDLSFQPPTLTKLATSPTLKTFNDMKRPSQDYSENIKQLSTNIQYLNVDQVEKMLSKVKVNNDLHLPNLMIIDVRSFTDYVKSHIANAINICLPSTLLKRPNFSFVRCINSLPLYEKLIIKTYYNFEELNKINNKVLNNLDDIPCSASGFPSVLIYDSFNNSMNLYFMIKKILDDKPNCLIYIIDSSFQQLNGNTNLMFENGNRPNFNIDELMNNDKNLIKTIPIALSPTRSTNKNSFSLNTTTNINTNKDNKEKDVLLLSDKFRSNSLNDLRLPVDSSTPILSNFKLPTMVPTPSFKIRHNEEVFDFSKIGVDLVEKYDLNNPVQFRNLPPWIKLDNIAETKLIEEFNNLEKIEKNRLNNVLNINNNGINNEISISSGIEKGHKNRYKDIFLYDHSRVKLVDFNQPQQCDYINASYINSIKNLKLVNDHLVNSINHEPNFKYIAAQGPLKHTIGDFYKSIINNGTKLIIALTNEFENGIMKCDPYWIPGCYYSNDNTIKIEINSTEKLNDNIVIRKIQITTEFGSREISQIQLLNWLDNDVYGNFNDLMKIINLKKLLITEQAGKNHDNNDEFLTLIHCSAGCGRTGTFITIDSLINLIELDYKFDKEIISKIVNNLRIQRISMVQNLRQFILIYEMLINYYLNGKK